MDHDEMNLPVTLSTQKRELLERLVERLAGIAHLQAVVLGGSYASGAATAASDLDMGLYYLDAEPFSIEAIRQAAAEIALVGQTPVVTGFHEWGAWVNGGAWIQTEAGKVDFLYRSLDHVGRVVREAQAGRWQHDYDQQPAHGFYSTGYLAETKICLPLYDPAGKIAELKHMVEAYPPALKQTIVSDSLWSAEFTLLHGRGFASKGDVYSTAGCLVRAAANLTQALFALNETYFLGDKRAMETLAGFQRLPAGYVEGITGILACPGRTQAEMMRSVEAMEGLWRGVVALTEGGYRAKF